MATKIKMPKLSDTMSVGVMNDWKKKEGDTVAPGDILAEVETDKANMELENFESGVLLKILVPKGGKVPVGGTIAIVGQKGENIDALIQETEQESKKPAGEKVISETPSKPSTPPTPPPKAAPAPAAPHPAPAIERKGRIKASPLARRMAEAKGVDIGTIYGSGPGGRIIKKDIEPLLAGLAGGAAPSAVSQQLPPLVAKDIPISQMRAAISANLSESKRLIPHYYVTMEIDMRRAIDLRESMKEAEQQVSYNDMITRACALALRRFPEVNVSYMGNEGFIRQHGNIHIAIAVAIADGLVTPVIRDADKKNLVQISSESRELATRAKERKLKPNEFTGSTFTTSNLGMFDIDDFCAIIQPKEAAILAIGSIVEKPVVEEGEIRVGHRMKLTLSCDHRAVDGAIAARFLKEVRRLLENPVLLIL